MMQSLQIVQIFRNPAQTADRPTQSRRVESIPESIKAAKVLHYPPYRPTILLCCALLVWRVKIEALVANSMANLSPSRCHPTTIRDNSYRRGRTRFHYNIHCLRGSSWSNLDYKTFHSLIITVCF
jgi:hypothetical protein